MIIFEKIRFRNFLSFGNIDQHVNFLNSKKTIILGSNGHGKSVLIDAITYVLFNKPFRKINKGGLVNTINKKDCQVEIHFRIKNNSYVVKRYMYPGLFEIYINGSLVPQDASIRDYQKYLENDILSLNYRTFTQIVILGSGSYTQFMKLSTHAKREIIEDILNISVFSRMNDLLKVKLKEAEAQLELLKKDKVLYKTQYNFMFDKIKKNSESKDKRIAEKNKELSTLEEDLCEKKALKDNIIAGKVPTPSDADIKARKKKLNEYKIGINKNLTTVGSEMTFYEENDVCPRCKHELSDAFKETRLGFLKNKKKEFLTALAKINDGIEGVARKLNKISKIKESNKNISEQVQAVENEIYSLKVKIGFLKSSITEIEAEDNTMITPKEIEDVKNMVKLADLNLQEQYAKINIMRLGATILKDNGAKISIIKFYLPLINKTINEFLERFDFNVSFTFDENFEEKMKARHIDSYRYGNFSEGERMRIDLSLMFTWREIAKKKNSASTNLLFFDEVLDSAMDGAGLSNFMEIVDDYDPSVNLFIISHREGVEAGFDSIMTAKKEGHFSEYHFS